MGAEMFEDFVRHCATSEAYASLKSVLTKEKADEMQSFLFAETFKYYYLLFSPDAKLDLHGVVLNTEAHLIRRSW
jgi:mannosidase alpha-like ER degradation enhancer 2